MLVDELTLGQPLPLTLQAYVTVPVYPEQESVSVMPLVTAGLVPKLDDSEQLIAPAVEHEIEKLPPPSGPPRLQLAGKLMDAARATSP